MKTKTKTAKPSHVAGKTPPDNATPIGISPEAGKSLRLCAENFGQSVESFVRDVILDSLEMLDGIHPLELPCPFCLKTDELEIYNWSQERRDGTEYIGEAMRCHRCEAIATMGAWMKRGLRGVSGNDARKGGVA